jgi:hypothetical protein
MIPGSEGINNQPQSETIQFFGKTDLFSYVLHSLLMCVYLRIHTFTSENPYHKEHIKVPYGATCLHKASFFVKSSCMQTDVNEVVLW